MSTRIHWAGEDGHRSCTHGRTATHREVSAAEFLRLSNLCRTCERAAQKEMTRHTADLPGLYVAEHAVDGRKHTSFVAHFGIGKLVTGSAVCAKRNGACFRIQATKTPGLLTGIRPDADVIPDVSYEWRFETPDALENVITLLGNLRTKWKSHESTKPEVRT